MSAKLRPVSSNVAFHSFSSVSVTSVSPSALPSVASVIKSTEDPFKFIAGATYASPSAASDAMRPPLTSPVSPSAPCLAERSHQELAASDFLRAVLSAYRLSASFALKRKTGSAAA